MDKILLIIQREYLTRVKKKSFLIMTIVGPILMAAMFVVPVWLATRENDQSQIMVVDESLMFTHNLPASKSIRFIYQPDITYEKAQLILSKTKDYDALLYIPKNIIEGGITIKLSYKKKIGALS